MDANQIPNAQGPTQVTTAAFAAKYRSKREVFTFLTVDVKASLPPMQTVTTYFLKDLVTGAKKCKYERSSLLANIRTDTPLDCVKQVHVPAYENLALKVIYAEFEKHPAVM